MSGDNESLSPNPFVLKNSVRQPLNLITMETVVMHFMISLQKLPENWKDYNVRFMKSQLILPYDLAMSNDKVFLW